MVQTTASAPPTTTTTVGNIAGQGVNIYRGDHNRPISHATTTFEYLAAAEVGRALASIEKCELRYSCPISGDQLKTIFNEALN